MSPKEQAPTATTCYLANLRSMQKMVGVEQPVLIIDDEADNASVNTGKFTMKIQKPSIV
ncbi:hypothetical protein OH492_24360 [Vibrio chagasii]|nr:hypothetical protein [Vibrio chagasii]